MHFMVQNGNIFGGCQNFKFFGGMPHITDIFWVNSRC